MKKIVSLLIISVFLASCSDNIEKTVVDDSNNTPLANEETNTWTIDKEIIVKEETQTWNIEVVEEKVNVKEPINEKVTVEDEKILESEVNDLLDEFIDSLDNYDK